MTGYVIVQPLSIPRELAKLRVPPAALEYFDRRGVLVGTQKTLVMVELVAQKVDDAWSVDFVVFTGAGETDYVCVGHVNCVADSTDNVLELAVVCAGAEACGVVHGRLMPMPAEEGWRRAVMLIELPD